MTAHTSSALRELSIQGFLGFPHSRASSPIPLDGDIVLLTGANGVGKSSLLEAIAYHETGATMREKPDKLVHIGLESGARFLLREPDAPSPITYPLFPDGSGENSTWQPQPFDRLRHLRTIYFHPHHLQDLFEENPPQPGASFADLLAPAPRAVDALRVALRNAQPGVEQTIDRLRAESGLTSEEARGAERRSLAATLNDRISGFRETYPDAGAWLAEFAVERLVIRSGNLRKNWEGELANIVRKILAASPETASLANLSERPTPAESLHVLGVCARSLASAASAATTPNSVAKPDPRRLAADLLGALPPEDWLALQEHVAGKTRDKLDAEFALKGLAEQRDILRQLRHSLGRGEHDLGTWTDDLQKRAATWQRLLPAAPRHQAAPPAPIAGWLQSLAKLADEWPTLEGQWREWAAHLDDREKHLSYELEIAERDHQRRRHLAQIHEALSRALFAQEPRLRETLLSADSAEAFLRQLDSTSSAPISPPKPTQAALAEGIASASEDWARRETEFAAEDARAASPAGHDLAQRLRELEMLRDAIESETKPADSRLLRLQQEAIDGALDPIQRFIKETAARFRLSDSIDPVRLLRIPPKGKSAARLALQVGRPPRDIGLASSGQRGQLGLLVFLGLHFGLRDTYRNRLICLDEITSSFDLAQIPRLALLLRQIAYAPSGSPFQRRIFLASHNEDFTQRLANLLAPPAGNSLRILRFTGYTNTEGPIIEPYQMHPGQPFDAEAMKTYFTHRYGPAAHA